MAKTQQPTPKTHPSLVHVEVYRVYVDQEGIQREGRRIKRVYDVRTFEQMKLKNGFAGMGVDVIHDPSQVKTRTRKTAE